MMKRILIIEDHGELRSSLELAFSSEGYHVRTLENGRGVLQVCLTWLPDLVIADIYMPARTGLEVMLELRQQWPATKIILMSGHPDALHLLPASEFLGADRTLFKPFELPELFKAVRVVLAEAR